jgi:hypothetical protein
MKMAKSTGKKSKSGIENLNAIHPNAAGIDIGATEIYIAVPGDRSDDPVRRFDTFTDDLHDAARWLKSCDIDSIAMESTGVYWIPVFQILVEIENHLKEFESRIYIDDIKLPPGKKGGRKPIPELRGRTDVILTQLILNRYFIIICC